MVCLFFRFHEAYLCDRPPAGREIIVYAGQLTRESVFFGFLKNKGYKIFRERHAGRKARIDLPQNPG